MAQIRRIDHSRDTVIELVWETTVFGREDNCQIVTQKNEDVSRKHCGLRRYEEGVFSITDYGSRNGTFVNDNQIFEETVLKHGDIIRVGFSLEFVFEDQVKVKAKAAVEEKIEEKIETKADVPRADERREVKGEGEKGVDAESKVESEPAPVSVLSEVPKAASPGPLGKGGPEKKRRKTMLLDGNPAMADAIDELSDELANRSFASVMKSIVNETKGKKRKDLPNQYW